MITVPGDGDFLLTPEEFDSFVREVGFRFVNRCADDSHRETRFEDGADGFTMYRQALAAGIDSAVHQAFILGQSSEIKPVAGQELSGPLDGQGGFVLIVRATQRHEFTNLVDDLPSLSGGGGAGIHSGDRIRQIAAGPLKRGIEPEPPAALAKE